MDNTVYSIELYIDHGTDKKTYQEDAERLLVKRLERWSPDQGYAWVTETRKDIHPVTGIFPDYLAPIVPGPGIGRLAVSFKLNKKQILRKLDILDSFCLPALDTIDARGHAFVGGYIELVSK